MLKPFLIKLQALSLQVFLKRDSNTSAFKKLLRTPILKNICKQLPLEVYKKAVLKNFAVLTGRKELVIHVLWKKCSWWLIVLWKESNMSLYWSTSLVKKMFLTKWAFLSLTIIWSIFFWYWIFLVKNNFQVTENTILSLPRNVKWSI